MKLTLALGLQYDSNRPAQVYALSVGEKKQVTAANPVTEIIPEDAAVHPQINSRWIMLTYNLHGLPMMQAPAASIDLFA